MKQGALIFNVVLAIAVVVLFFLYLKPRNTIKDDYPETSEGGIKILYVNFDSLQSRYLLYQELVDKFEADQIIREDKIRKQQTALERKYREFQDGRMAKTERELAKLQQELAQMEQRLQMDAQDLSNKAAIQQAEMSARFMDSLTVFFDDYGREKGVDLIMTNQQAAGVFYANPKYDITNEAVERLNKRYRKSKPEGGN